MYIHSLTRRKKWHFLISGETFLSILLSKGLQKKYNFQGAETLH